MHLEFSTGSEAGLDDGLLEVIPLLPGEDAGEELCLPVDGYHST